MPRRKTPPPPLVPESDERVQFPHIAAPATEYVTSAAEDRREQELEDIVDQMGSDSRIVIYHVIEGKAQPTYAGPMPVEGFSLEGVLETYGGGDKAVTVYQAGRKMGTWRVSLDPSVPPTSPRAKMAARMMSSGVAPSSSSSELLDKMMLMQATSADMMQKTMIGIMGAVTGMLTAQRPQSSDLDTVVKIAEVLKSTNGNGTPASEMIGMFREGIALAGRLGGGDDDGTLGVVREGLAVVGKIVENNARLPAAPVPRSLPPAAAAPVAPPPTPSPEPTPTVPDRPWIAAARPFAPLLLAMVGNFQPATAAQGIADRFSDEQFEDLLNDVESGTPAEFVQRFLAAFSVDPATVNDDQGRWLLQLVQDVKALVEDETPEPVEDTKP